MQGNGRSSWPRGLILAPTRELVQQIFDEARKFCYKTGLRCAVAYGGGENMRDQLRCVCAAVSGLCVCVCVCLCVCEGESVFSCACRVYVRVFVLDEESKATCPPHVGSHLRDGKHAQ